MVYDNQRRVSERFDANGWQAVFYDSETGEAVARPLVCWARYTEDDSLVKGPHIEGIAICGERSADVHPCPNNAAPDWCDLHNGFLGYLAPGEEIPEWMTDEARTAKRIWDSAERLGI